MSDESNEPVDVDLETSVHSIARLASERSMRLISPLGVLQPFSSHLVPRRPRADRRPAPLLEYLTLHPLLVEHLHEHTHVDGWTETVERTESPDKAPQLDDDSTGGDIDTMTVREFLTRQPAGADDATDADDDTEGTTSSPSESDGRGPDTGAPPPDDLDANAGPISDAQSRPARTSDARRGRSSGRSSGATTPRTTLDMVAPGTDAEPPRPTVPSAAGRGPIAGSMDAGLDGPPSTGRRPGEAHPELTLADQPVQTMTADRYLGSDEVPLTVASGERSARDLAAGEERHDRTHRRSRPGRPPSVAEDGIDGPSARSTPSVDRDGVSEPADPVSALDDLDRPDLDRFVERLSDELARHERIERERRGR